MPKRGRNFLMTPGPTAIPDRVLAAMQRPALDLADADLIEDCRRSIDELRGVFRTAGEVFVYAGNGHGGWEAAIANVISPGDRVLALENGMFSVVWAEAAGCLGARPEVIEGDWRHAVDPQRLEQRLRADRDHAIRAVLVAQTDTSTGIGCDLRAVRAAMDAAGHPALLMADVVASLGTTGFRMDEWGVDVAMCASQKAMMMPTGLAFVAAGPRARAAAGTATMPRYYWDWERRRGKEFYTWFCGTAPVHLMFALRAALDMIAEEGLEAMHARHARLAAAARAAVSRWAEGGALEHNPVVPAERADSVTTIRTGDGVDADAIRRACADRYDVSLGAGYRKLSGRAFRIGHMGWVNEATVLGALAAVEATLRALGIAHAPGGTEAALDALAAADAAARSSAAAD